MGQIKNNQSVNLYLNIQHNEQKQADNSLVCHQFESGNFSLRETYSC